MLKFVIGGLTFLFLVFIYSLLKTGKDADKKADELLRKKEAMTNLKAED